MNLVEVLNTIRDNASNVYQERIPEATRDNISEIRESMIDGDNIIVANEFVSTILNKIVKSVVHTKIFTNPLKTLKKGTKPLGDAVEEIYNNFLKGEAYDPNGVNLLKRNLPDTKTVYHRMNYKNQYTITVSRELLAKAFASYEALESFVNNLINTLYNSAELDEFINTKELIRAAYENNAIKVIDVPEPLESKENGETFIKTVKTISGLMVFPSEEYNSYLSAQNTDEKAITTFSRKDEQILIIDTATDTSVAIDVLASAFNMSVADFNDTRKIVIDNFPDKSIRAALVDEMFFQIYDDLFTITSFHNGQGLYDNYYLNVWQTLAYSILVNAVAFRVVEDKDNDGAVGKYSVTYNLAEGATSSNKRNTASEGSSFTTTIGGQFSSVTVNMGGSIVPDAFNLETRKVFIDEVTGDIEITVS